MAFASLLVISLFFNTSWIDAAPIDEGRVTIELDGLPVDIHYFHSPPADPSQPFHSLLFVHGFPTGDAIWVPVMDRLSQKANVDSYAIDMLGFGQSGAPAPVTFDYSEASLNRVPFKVADGLGIDRFIGVAHDVGGAWFLCPATEPRNLARLDGLIVLDTAINVFKLPLEPLPGIKLLGSLMGDLGVPRSVVRELSRFALQADTFQDVFAKFPGIVEEIAATNSEEAHRLAISRIIEEETLDPLAFGGVCAESIGVLDTLGPLLIWAPPDLISGLLIFSVEWPSAHRVFVSEAKHFLMLDQEEAISTAIAAYLSAR
ncbi:MAG: alpha/beta fold hydrolase [Acidobacteriota bacterium]